MDGLKRGFRQLRWSIESRGVRETVSLALKRATGRDPGMKAIEWSTHPFDTENGVETGGRIGGSHLGGGHAHDVYNVAYQGTPPSRLRHAIERWQSLPGAPPLEEVAFFDIGCGKGRAVMLASQLGFREAAGVELDPELARIGGGNLETWRGTGKARCPVEMVQGDATEVPLPALPCVFWMYNPFRGPVVSKMLARLDQHAGEREGEMDVIYMIPNEAAQFSAFPRFRKMWEGMVAMSEEDQRWDGSDVEDLGQIWRR